MASGLADCQGNPGRFHGKLRGARGQLSDRGGQGGICVHFGTSQSATATFESNRFFQTGGARLYGLSLFYELRGVEPAADGLALLARLVADGRLQPHIAIEAPWSEIGNVACQLLERSFNGKAVLRVA